MERALLAGTVTSSIFQLVILHLEFAICMERHNASPSCKGTGMRIQGLEHLNPDIRHLDHVVYNLIQPNR